MKIGLDVGGTNLRTALINKYDILRKEQKQYLADGSLQDAVDVLCGIVNKFFDENMEPIRVEVSSVIDSDSGTIYNTVDIPSWKEARPKETLHRCYNVPIVAEDDSNCLALGVSLYEQDNKLEHMIGIILGIGLGCDAVVNGKLYRGANGAAGEMDSLPYLDGDVEHYCGSTFFPRFCHKTALQPYSLVTNDDVGSIEKWREFGCRIENMARIVMFVCDPGMIYLGGGISRAFSLFEQPMNEMIKSFPYPKSTKLLQIGPTRLQNVTLLGTDNLI